MLAALREGASIGAQVDSASRVHVVLGLRGSELDPDRVTARLGVAPTRGSRRGQSRKLGATGHSIVAKVGFWCLDVRIDDLAKLDETVHAVVASVVSNQSVWRELCSEFAVELTLVFYLYRANEGAGLDPKTLKLLSENEIPLEFDLYSLADAGAENDG